MRKLDVYSIWIPITLMLVFVLGFTVRILQLNAGVFSYMIDDVYIQLALAEGILHGHYGINPYEYSAPSSSILWPFLVAPFTKEFFYFPLFLTTVFSIGSVVVFADISKIVTDGIHRHRELIALTLVLFLMVSANIISLTFLGMEHSLQVFLTVLLVWGLIRQHREGKFPLLIYPVIVILPLVRYECLLLTTPTLIYLAYKEKWLQSILTGFVMIGLLATFSFYLHSIGLGFLPSSVLSKSTIAGGNNVIFSIVKTPFIFLGSRSFRQEAVFFLMSIPLLYYVANRKYDKSTRILGLVLYVPVVSALIWADLSWRREVFISVIIVISIIYLYRSFIRSQANENAALLVFILLTISIVAFGPYFRITKDVPLAANSTYRQKGQMHRFVAEFYRDPVAVNDIGWVSYENDNYVLDLWGLGSYEALVRRKTEPGIAWMTYLANKHDVKLAMIFDAWFPMIPQNWLKIGELTMGKPTAGTPYDRVAFYVIGRSKKYCILIKQLEEFKESLPSGTDFEFMQPSNECDSIEADLGG